MSTEKEPQGDSPGAASTTRTTPSRESETTSKMTPNGKETASLGKAEDVEHVEDAIHADSNDYPPLWQAVLITAGLCLSVFCMSLDNTIIATAIPRITDEFNSLGDVGWYGSAYLLTTCAFQLFFGKLYTFLPVKSTFLIAILIFEIGSVVCGAAPNSTALIVGRAIAGLGAAGIFSGAFLITAYTVTLGKRPIYTGIVGSMYGIASIAGPLIGGAFTDRVTWRWCFYINLPIGGATIFFIILFFKPPKTRSQQAQNKTWLQHLRFLDLPGLFCFVPSVVCILLALQWGGTTYPWSNWRTVLLLVLFVVLMLAFVLIQISMKSNATIPANVIKQRTVVGSMLFAFMVGSSFFSTIYFLPIWFQVIKGADATNSGVMNLPTLLAMIIFSVLSGGAVSYLGYYSPFVLGSTVFMAIGAGLLTTFQVDTGRPKWIGYQVLYGVGMGLGFQQPLIAVQTVLPLELVPIGTALVIFSQTFGGAVFLSASENIFTNQLVESLAMVIPNVDPKQLVSGGAGSIIGMVPPQLLPVVFNEYNYAITRTFFVGVATSSASIIGALLMEWKKVEGESAIAAGA